MRQLLCVAFPCLETNVGVLIQDTVTGEVAAVDVPDACAVLQYLRDYGWSLTSIFITHHHKDHIQGVPELVQATGARVFGPAQTLERSGIVTQPVHEGQILQFGNLPLQVIATPGHTQDHVVYWFPEDLLAFTGDTLFVMGCGRLLEGTAEQLWNSLERLSRLFPDETEFYCGHDYAIPDAEFAVSLEPENALLQSRLSFFKEEKAQGILIQPGLFGQERHTNPFLRAADPSFQALLDLKNKSAAEVFAELRRRKDHFY